MRSSDHSTSPDETLPKEQQPMSERVTAVADRFNQASTDFLAKAEALSDEQWAASRDGDPRSAGVIAHHVAVSYESTVNILRALLAGKELGVTMDMVHSENAAHAEANEGAGKDETVALLRSNAAHVLTALRGLREEQLDQLVSFPLFGADPMPAQAIIDGLVIGHIGMHAQDLPA
jgi:hypothetical protein